MYLLVDSRLTARWRNDGTIAEAGSPRGAGHITESERYFSLARWCSISIYDRTSLCTSTNDALMLVLRRRSVGPPACQSACIHKLLHVEGSATGVSSASRLHARTFCFSNIVRHFKNTNMGFVKLLSRHGPHHSFASETVLSALSPCKRMAPPTTVTPCCHTAFSLIARHSARLR
jgi:hypothetical protein